MTMHHCSQPVVIVGSGVIGTACAYYLAQSGVPVTLLDKGHFAAACSRGNCGYICPSHVLPLAVPGALTSTLKTLVYRNSPLKLRFSFLLKNLGWFMKFAWRCNRRDMLHTGHAIQAILNQSRHLYEQLMIDENLDAEWDTHGLLFVYQSASAIQHYAEINQLLAEQFNMPAEKFEADQLLDLEPALKPGSVAGGYLYKSDAQVRPEKLMTAWRAKLEHRGVQILEGCEFQHLKSSQTMISSVVTSRGELPCSAVVLATGAWTPLWNQHLGVKVPIIPGKGYSLTMPRPKLCPTYPMIFEEHRVAISPFQSGYRIGSTMEFSGYDESIPESRLELLKHAAQLYLKEPLSEPIQNQWFGWRPMVYDGLPIIDRSPKWKNAYIAAGHGMLGLSMATGTGQLVSQLILGQTPSLDPKPYQVARF